MSERRAARQTIPIAVGYAASRSGTGVAYARLLAPAAESLLRVPFALNVQPALLGRDVAYAALRAIAAEVRAQGVERARFLIDDPHLPLDIEERRRLPQALVLPYVALRCEFNRLRQADVVFDEPKGRDLAARARAEVSLNVAA